MELSTERLQATYDLIMKNSKAGILTTKKEIVDNYPYNPQVRRDGYKWNDSPTTHDNCSTVWEDINEINFTEGVDVVIISHRGNYWVGTKKEADDYKKKYFNSQIKPALKRYWNIYRKLERDGSMDLFTKELVKATMEDEQ